MEGLLDHRAMGGGLALIHLINVVHVSVRVAVRVFVSLLEPVRRLPLRVDCNLLASAAKNNAEAVIDALLL